MKKGIVIIVIILSTYFASNAQVSPHAIGGRIGGGLGYGIEFSYQHGLSSKNRLEFDLGFGGNSHYGHFGVAGIYHWVWNIDGGFNWYIGPGVH